MILQEWDPHAYSSFIFFERKFSCHSINGDFNKLLENSELKKDSRDPWVEFINGEKSDWLTGLVVRVKPSNIIAAIWEEVNPRPMSILELKFNEVSR